MKTPEQMAEEYADNSDERRGHFPWKQVKDSYLAGYQAAKDEDKAKMQELKTNWKFCCENKARLLNELAAAERAKDQLADTSKVMCNTTMEEIKAVDTGEIIPITNLPMPAKWISVKERLPEDKESVIYWHDLHGTSIGHYDSTYPKPNYHWWSYSYGDNADFRVQWWMPLPKIPKAPKGEG